MKGIKDTRASARAALKRLKNDAKTIATLADQQLSTFDKSRLPALRGFANDLLRRIHEYNAYMNVLKKDAKERTEPQP
jgi:two-component sensor histidine kinase